MKKVKLKVKISRCIDCTGENCPMPLIKTRKAIMEVKEGEIIEVIGTHPQSFKEIPMALEAMGKEIIELKKEGQNWCIIFKV